MAQNVRIALSKGRILEDVLPLLARVGIRPRVTPDESRKLVLETDADGIELVILRNNDVPTFVRFGATHLGVVGKDVLLEDGGEGLAELLDLGVSRCRLVVAQSAASRDDGTSFVRRMRVATKYPKVTQQHFATSGVQADIIRLYGSMELAPLVGLADRIVDLVDTGSTLRANNLLEIEEVAQVSARLIANLAALRMHSSRIREIVALIASEVAQ